MDRLWAGLAMAGGALVVWRFPRLIDLLSRGDPTSVLPALTAILLPAAAAAAWYFGRRPSRLQTGGLRERLAGDSRFVTGVAVVTTLCLAAWLAPVLTTLDPNVQPDLLGGAGQPPSLTHPLGTDRFSRDLLSRMLYGARWSLSVALLAVALMIVVGTLVGLTAGVAGGWVDATLMRLVDTGLAIPRTLLLLVVASLWRDLSLAALAGILGLTGWFGTSRLVRAEVLSLRQREFLDAATALGVDRARLVLRHLLPNLAAPITVTAALGVGNLVLAEAGLSYLGIGARPPDPGWGNIIRDGQDFLLTAPWIAVFPGLAIFATVVGFSLVGDGLQSALDPRST